MNRTPQAALYGLYLGVILAALLFIVLAGLVLALGHPRGWALRWWLDVFTLGSAGFIVARCACLVVRHFWLILGILSLALFLAIFMGWHIGLAVAIICVLSEKLWDRGAPQETRAATGAERTIFVVCGALALSAILLWAVVSFASAPKPLLDGPALPEPLPNSVTE
jgi:hypothetical protein